MSRKPFYQVSPETYLFPSQCRIAGVRKQPEEPVRQWCAFELMRAYGISVTQLEFERSVRVGSKTYRIDILVLRDGVPWIVVECKKRAHTKSKAAMDQAISYAGAQGVQAEFAVYTNGHEWHVQRRICGEWVPVTDLPVQNSHERSEPITEILRGILSVAPLLHNLDETLEGADAQNFLKAMQVFFNGKTLMTDDANDDLIAATDNLLRALAASDQHPDYRLGKLETARQHLATYFLRAGLGIILAPVMGDTGLGHEIQMTYATLTRVIEGTSGLLSADAFLLRLDISLLEYGLLLRGPNPSYPQIKPSLHSALREYLSYALAVHLNTTLPDPLDRLLIGDMKSYCQDIWQRFQAGEQKPPFTFGQFLSSISQRRS